MRILHLLNHTRRLNGHVHAAIDLACAQRELGHTVAIASEGGDFDALLAANGIETFRVSHERKPGKLMKGFGSLREAARNWRPDVVHAHMMTSAVLAWPVCRMAGIPLVTTVHNEFQKSSILMGLGTRVISVSEAVRASMQKRGVPKNKLHVVLNGTIGSARFKGKTRAPQTLDHPAIIFVGGLHPRKGLPDLLAAFDIMAAKRPEARLYILGGGPHQQEYEALARSLPCAASVKFMGALDEPFPYLMGADVFVLPSHADPAPLVLSEAREAGCAIVATKVDGIPQLLEGGQAGILVPPHDPRRIADELIKLIEDPQLLAAWRRKSQINIDYLRIDRVARETVEIYRAAYGKRRGRTLQTSIEPSGT